jgi:hypothetical protein
VLNVNALLSTQMITHWIRSLLEKLTVNQVDKKSCLLGHINNSLLYSLVSYSGGNKSSPHSPTSFLMNHSHGGGGLQSSGMLSIVHW